MRIYVCRNRHVIRVAAQWPLRSLSHARPSARLVGMLVRPLSDCSCCPLWACCLCGPVVFVGLAGITNYRLKTLALSIDIDPYEATTNTVYTIAAFVSLILYRVA